MVAVYVFSPYTFINSILKPFVKLLLWHQITLTHAAAANQAWLNPRLKHKLKWKFIYPCEETGSLQQQTYYSRKQQDLII